MGVLLLQGDCRECIKELLASHQNAIIVSDPPFNIGYRYNEYRDKMPEKDYFDMLRDIFGASPSVVVHYPEQLYQLAICIGTPPTRVVSWVYNSNTAKQHRDIAFWGVKPDFGAVRQPYKNLNDKRIKERIAAGKTGAKLYDWWNVNQVKNISKEKVEHPCQMPLEVMKNIIGILPPAATIIDPFMGSGTTGVACKQLGRSFVGVELNRNYFEIAKERISKEEKE